MPLIVTPGQLTQRADFYYQLNQLTTAGIGLVEAFRHIQKHPPSRSYRAPIQRSIAQLAQGATFTEAIQSAGPWLPEFDVTLIAAGEQSGRADQCFRLLSDHYSDRARMARQMIADLAYPVFLFHFFIFISSFPQFFLSGDWVTYLIRTVGVLLPIYVVVILLLYAMQSKHGETWRSWIESLLHYIPALGTARRSLALARLSAALEALISAGVNIIEAWELAAAASGSPALRRIVLEWRPRLDVGQTPSEVLNASGKFPELFASQYSAGEISGKLDETLRRMHGYYQDEGSRKIRAVAKWVPMFIYLIIVALIAYHIVQFYTDRFRQVNDAMTM